MASAHVSALHSTASSTPYANLNASRMQQHTPPRPLVCLLLQLVMKPLPKGQIPCMQPTQLLKTMCNA